MTRLFSVALTLALVAAIPAIAFPITEDFESFALGSLHGQTGSGGVTWSKNAVGGTADAYAALPGHTGAQCGRWDVKDIGTISEGDDMVGTFASVGPQVVVTAWTYSFLSFDPLYPGNRAGSFIVYDNAANYSGIGLVWRPDGKMGSTLGHVSNVSFVNEAWKQIRIELDYTSQAWSLYYDSQLVAAGVGLAAPGVAASTIGVTLETKNLEDNPNPNDTLLMDDILVTPEPASLALLGLLALLRRR